MGANYSIVWVKKYTISMLGHQLLFGTAYSEIRSLKELLMEE